MSASILGVGAITPFGRDLESIKRAFHFGAERGGAERSSSAAPGSSPLRVPDELLADATISKRMRRADRFSKMLTLAALDAWSTAAQHNANIPLERIGLIVSTGFGPHARGFKFLDGILDCGDSAALPTDFSHSVHNAAASYVAELLGLRGPTLTTTDFESGFESAVQLAQCWLQGKTCDRVLVGAAEELGEVMLHCAIRMIDQPIQPSEGAVFFTLAPADVQGIASLEATSVHAGTERSAVPGSSHSTPFGHNASFRAFHLLANLLDVPIPIDNPALFPASSAPGATKLLLTRHS